MGARCGKDPPVFRNVEGLRDYDLRAVARQARAALRAVGLRAIKVRFDDDLCAVMLGADEHYPLGVVGIGIVGHGPPRFDILTLGILIHLGAFADECRFAKPWPTRAGEPSAFTATDDDYERTTDAIAAALSRLVTWRLQAWASATGVS